MRLLPTELFFAAGISLTVDPQPVIIRYYYTPPQMRERMRKQKKGEGRGGRKLIFWRDDALFKHRLRLLPEGQKDFSSLSNYVSSSPPSLK